MPFENAAGDSIGRRSDPDRAGRGHLLEARGEVRGVALGGIVHAEVVTDAADHDGPRVDAKAHLEWPAPAPLNGLSVAGKIGLNIQRRLQRPHGVVFVADGSPEESHDAVAGELIDRAFVTMDVACQDIEAAIHDRMDAFRIEAL